MWWVVWAALVCARSARWSDGPGSGVRPQWDGWEGGVLSVPVARLPWAGRGGRPSGAGGARLVKLPLASNSRTGPLVNEQCAEVIKTDSFYVN